MKSLKLLLPILLFGSLLFAKSSVWVVKSDKNEIYLGGSIHILRKSDYPLPIEFDKAYKKSEIIVFETDIGVSPQSVQALMFEKGFYPDGVTLKNKISKETYRTLTNYCDKNSFPLIMIEKMVAPLAMYTLLIVEYQKLSVDIELGVDMHFYKKAVADKKSIDTFETIEEQMDFFVKLGRGEEDKFVKNFLKDMSKQNENLVEIIKAWYQGDDEVIVKYLQDFKKNSKDYENLLTKRNNNWMSKIKNYLKTPKKEFLIVGAAHLVGEDGLVKKLRDLGYKVERF